MLYPPIEPHSHGMLDVGQGHRLFWEECGQPAGQAVVFLHGGPGAGCTATSRRFFDPQRYRIILFDQRGCGRSEPHASTEHNLLANLVADMEALRQHRAVDKWLLFGGSWGSTLALAYARSYADRVSGMVLRGVFTGRGTELNWLYREGGASQIFPDKWHRFVNALDEPHSGDWLADYAQLLHSPDHQTQMRAALAWCQWEQELCSVDFEAQEKPEPHSCLAMARISTHMFMHDPDLGCGLEVGDQDVWQHLTGIPGVIVQGRYDMVTPVATAWALHRAWPGSRWRLVHNAGHSSADLAMRHALVETMDEFVFR
jgi:proline iminopeptidase